MLTIGFVCQCVPWTFDVRYNLDSSDSVKLVTQKDYVSNIEDLGSMTLEKYEPTQSKDP
jgi:hypothetical protein